MSDENISDIDRIFLERDPIHKLKRQLEVDKKIASDDGKFIVQYDWAALAKNGESDIDGLEMENSEKRNGLTDFSDIVIYSFYGKFNKNTVSIKISQAPNISKAAEYMFLGLITNRTETSYIPSSVDLGTISVQDSHLNPNQHYLWVYKNVCFDVSGIDAKSVLALSKKLQELAEKHLVQISN